MAWFIDDLDQTTIFITNTVQEYYIPKFTITMRVAEPILYLTWSDRQTGTGGDERVLPLNYLDVVDSYSGYIDNPTSATDLMAQIEAMIISGWTSISTGGGDILNAKSQLLGHDGVSDVIIVGGANESIVYRNDATQSGYDFITKEDVVVGGLSVDGVTITGTGAAADPLVAVSAKSSYIFASTGTVASTNTASIEALWNVQIPGGTLAVNDWVEVKYFTRKTSGVGSNTFQVRFNSATGTGGSIISSFAGSSVQSTVGGPMISITGASAQIGSPGFNGTTYGVAAVDTVAGVLPIASDIWINFTNTKVTSTDGFELRTATVIIHKYRP